MIPDLIMLMMMIHCARRAYLPDGEHGGDGPDALVRVGEQVGHTVPLQPVCGKHK